MTNCISNIINTQNNAGSNPAALKLFNKNKQQNSYITAPDSLPKYSLNKALKQEDEFRKTVVNESTILNKPNKKSGSKKLLVAGAVLLTALCMKLKKKA